MTLIFLVVGAVLVVAIALVAVGRVVAGTAGRSRPAVYELPAAVEWIADRLPHEVTARVSYDDVGHVLRWHLEWFSDLGMASKHGEEIGGDASGDTGGVAAEDAAIDAVVARSLTSGGPDPIDVVCILDLQMRYLEAIGALEQESNPANDPS